MRYESPIELLSEALETQIEGDMFKCVQRYGFNVDKDELERALRYDRGQYEKGFREGTAQTTWEMSEIIDAQQSRIEELEKQQEDTSNIGVLKVVRCKDCKHWGRNVVGNSAICSAWGRYSQMAQWCSFGERKEE